MHIAVAGNIGSGKTTLTRLLAKHFKWEPHFEDVVDNLFDDFTIKWKDGHLIFDLFLE
jgi:deoxyadenosine/deoxycytidine kinase